MPKTPTFSANLAGFTHIPLSADDLKHFGREIEAEPRLLRAVHRDYRGHETGRETIYGGANTRYQFNGTKSLFRSPSCGDRLVLADGPLSAICLAALEDPATRRRSAYAAPSGPMSDAAAVALQALLQTSAPREVVLAFKPASDGRCRSRDICAHVLAELLLPTLPAVRLMPPPGGGWVEALNRSRAVCRAA